MFPMMSAGNAGTVVADLDSKSSLRSPRIVRSVSVPLPSIAWMAFVDDVRPEPD